MGRSKEKTASVWTRLANCSLAQSGYVTGTSIINIAQVELVRNYPRIYYVYCNTAVPVATGVLPT